jgi:pilus assembly protein CpaD
MTILSLNRPTRAWRAPLAAVILGSGLVVVAGCTPRQVGAVEVTGAVPGDYRVNHPIAVEEAVETLDVPVGLYVTRLNDAMRANVAAFAQRFVTSGSSIIAVVAPSGSPNQNVAAVIAVQVEDVLRTYGIQPGQIDYRVYHAAADERNAPIRVAFSRIVAHTAPCMPWPDQLAVSRENRNYFNFGCATQQNLAAVVDNPLDLLYPRGLTPADAARRATVLEKYRNGEAFGADTTQERAGSIAQGVGQ